MMSIIAYAMLLIVNKKLIICGYHRRRTEIFLGTRVPILDSQIYYQVSFSFNIQICLFLFHFFPRY